MKQLIIILTLTMLPIISFADWQLQTAENLKKKRWAFNYCNGKVVPIKVKIDQNMPAEFNIFILRILEKFNTTPLGPTYLYNTRTVDSNKKFGVKTIRNFYKNPPKNQLWIVYDTTGEIFEELGLDPDYDVVFSDTENKDKGRPHHICAGLIVLNQKLLCKNYRFEKVSFIQMMIDNIGFTLGFEYKPESGENKEKLAIETIAPLVTATDFKGIFSTQARNEVYKVYGTLKRGFEY